VLAAALTGLGSDDGVSGSTLLPECFVTNFKMLLLLWPAAPAALFSSSLDTESKVKLRKNLM
jgi:hypothetical protein